MMMVSRRIANHLQYVFYILRITSLLSQNGRMKMTAFAFSWPSNIQHTKTSRSVYFRKTNPVVRLPFALGAGEISGDMEPSKFEEMNRDEILEVLDKSLRQHTSLGILEQIQIMYNDDDDDDDDDNDLSDSDTGNESQTLIIPSLDMIHTTMRFALVSHGKDEGTIDGALHNYANFGALSTFETRYDILLRIPARKLAPVGNHQYELEDKLQLLRNRIGGRDVVDDYNGFRCTKDQTPIYIRNGLMWNCYDDNGEFCGQALLFDRDKIEEM